MTQERLQKYLARCGIASRRKCEELIANGKIQVNNQIITEMGYKVDPKKDQVIYENKIVKPAGNFIYYALNKPAGYITTAKDSHAEKIVTELVPESPRVFPVGRLDQDTTGLLILTNDGDLAYQLTHPKFDHPKTYLAKTKIISKRIDSIDKTQNALQLLRQGIELEDGPTTPAKLSEITIDFPNRSLSVKITITEGRKRQIKRMFEHIGMKVISLKRLQIGKLNIGKIPEGKYKIINKEEII